MSTSDWENRLQAIGGAEKIEQLRAVRETEQRRLAAKLSDSAVAEVVQRLNGLHDALIVRALKLAESDLARLGHGAPPVPYTYILFGSAGRYEQTLSSDQDSGIVFADADNEADAQRHAAYFSLFAQTAVQTLIALGYPPCDGDVIASNPKWNKSLSDWERQIHAWIADASWDNVRCLLILADGRSIAGDPEMLGRLKERFYSDRLSHPVIDKRMLENTLRHKMLVGVFGQLLTERYGEEAGSLDIKYGAYIPMVNAVRLLAVRAGLREASTLRRISLLNDRGVLTDEEAGEATEAFELILKARMLTTSVTEEGRIIGTGKLSRDQLTKEMTDALKKALKTGKALQRRVERELQYRFGGR